MARRRTRSSRRSKSRTRRTARAGRGRRAWRARARKAARGARRQQKRWGLRMSSRGFRRAKRKGKTKAKRSTFMRLRRTARNPEMRQMLRDGSVKFLHEDGDRGIVRVFDARGELVLDQKLPWPKAVARYRKYKSGRRASARQTRDDWAMVAADNPRRGRRRKASTSWGKLKPLSGWGVKRKRRNCGGRSRRNPAQFPTPFASALNPGRSRRNAPLSAAEARALARVLAKHGYGRRRR